MKPFWKRIAWATGGYIGVVTAVIGFFAWLFPDVFKETPWQVWVLIVVLAGLCITLLGTALFSQLSVSDAHDLSADDKASLYEAIPGILKDAFERGDYREVIRFGEALSRPLFESGEFDVRLRIGTITEEAAAHLGAVDVQYRTLIDSIGWSLIELGDFRAATSRITHGKELAIVSGDAFYEAKASRHLGAIERRKGNNGQALDFYKEATEAAGRIFDLHEKAAMAAGITYATAHLEYSRQRYDDALDAVELAIQQFRDIEDIYRVDMALVLKADIQTALKQRDRAKDTYRSVIQSSKMNRESVHYARAVLGLSELYTEDGKVADAARLLSGLDAEHISRMPAFHDRFRVALAAAEGS